MTTLVQAPALSIVSFGDATSDAVSLGSNATPGNRIVVGILHGSNRTVSSIADTAGTTYTALSTQFNGAFGRIQFWSGIAASADAGDSVVVTLSGSHGDNSMVAVFEVAGTAADQSAISVGNADETTQTSLQCGSVTPATVNDFIICIQIRGNRGYADDSDFTEVTTGAASHFLGYVENIGSTSAFEGVNVADDTTNSSAQTISLIGVAAASVTVTDVDTDETVTGEQTNVVITGTGFEASQGGGIVELVDQDDLLTQEVANYDSWSDTSIQVDLTIGTSTGVRYGSGKIKVTNDSTDEGELAVTITAPAGKNYVDLSTLAPGEDADSIAEAQTYAAATPLSLEALAADIDPPRRASFTADSNESGTNFTIIGDDENGNPDTEVVAGPNNGTVYSDGYWSVIDSITPDATEGTDEIEVGQESLRLYTNPDMASGDQLEWSNVVGGAIGDVTVNNDGTFTAAEGVTAFDFRVHNQTEGWGAIETQDVGSGEVAPTITTTTLPDATRLSAYNETIVATGDTPIVWDMTSGALPAGITLVDDELDGTPTEVGTFNFTVRATNAAGADTQALELEVLPIAPTITTTTAPTGNVGAGYSLEVEADGDAPFTWDISAGALPDGLTIDPDTGVISGVPEVEDTFNFTVRATNDGGNDTQALEIVINAAIEGVSTGGRGRRLVGRCFAVMGGR